MRISDWSSDVCSSDLLVQGGLCFAGCESEPQWSGWPLRRICGAGRQRSRNLYSLILSIRLGHARPRLLSGSERPDEADPRRLCRTSGKDVHTRRRTQWIGPSADRKRVVSGKSVAVSVDLGGRGIIKKKKKLN